MLPIFKIIQNLSIFVFINKLYIFNTYYLIKYLIINFIVTYFVFCHLNT